MVDIVASGFDAGLRFPESVPEDMIAAPVGKTCRFAVVVSPQWLDKNGPIHEPNDLLSHECVRYRFPSGRLFKWEFEKAGERIDIDPKGRIMVGNLDLATTAALEGIGPACVVEESASTALADGRLVRVLEDWCSPFPGPVLYYPQQRRISSALKAFIEMARQPR
jgi:DNA-binding transcriptional LysR family regulator